MEAAESVVVVATLYSGSGREEGGRAFGVIQLGFLQPRGVKFKTTFTVGGGLLQEKALFSPGVCSLNFNYSLFLAQEGH